MSAEPASMAMDRTGRTPTLKLLKWFLQPTTGFSVIILALFIVMAIGASAIAPYGSNSPTGARLASPGLAYPFGTDNLNRDVLSRTIYGARASFEVGLLSVLLGTLLGAVVGIISGYFGGWLDVAAQRVVDILMALPGILLALVVSASLGFGLLNISIAIGLAILPVSARVVRASTLAIRGTPYIEAARAVGAGHVRIVRRHILPNVIPSILVIASVQLGFAIIAEASLSYLGLGLPLSQPSWGRMVSGQSLLFMRRAPWMGLAPGLALVLVVMAANLLGDALRDSLDPRMRGGGG